MALLEARNLCLSYAEGQNVLSKVDAAIETGEFVAVLGPNGSGKTTLLRALAGLLKPTGGKVLLEGRDIARWKPKDLYKNIGFVFQDPNDQLFASTVAEDVAFGPANAGIPRTEIQSRVTRGLHEVGMEAQRDHMIHTLSFGQKRRVALAGVLAMEPRMIFLDEPTSGLDPHAAARIMNLFKGLNRRKKVTFLMATHDVDMASLYASRVDVLNNGRIAGTGLPASVFSKLDVLRESCLKLPHLHHAFRVGALDSRAGRIPVTLAGLPSDRHGASQTWAGGPDDLVPRAAGAAAAAALLFQGEQLTEVELRTPSGEIFNVPITGWKRDGPAASVKVEQYRENRAVDVEASGMDVPGLEIEFDCPGASGDGILFDQVIADSIAGLVPEGKGVRILFRRTP